MAVRDRLLGSSVGYRTFLRLIRAERFLTTIAREYLRVPPGGRLLDLGCGEGALSEHVSDATYVGIDHNAAYIDTARQRHAAPNREFVCADLAHLAETESGTFDVVCAVGVLHHLDDELVVKVLREAMPLLRPGGSIVTVDPVFHPEQRSIARVLMSLDRGRFVRHPEHYRSLAEQTAAIDETALRFDLNPFPYTHLIMRLAPVPVAHG